MKGDTPPLLELQHVRITVPGRVLVHDLSCEIRPGEMWCLLGPNGAGKTMLLHTIIGARKLHRGDIRITGQSVSSLKVQDAALLRAFVPQAVGTPVPVRVLDAVLVARHPYLSSWAWESEADRNRARNALRAMDALHLADHDLATLSGGEQQRVAIASLLVQDTPLALLDEPLAHLDLRHQVEVLSVLRELSSRRSAVLFAAHDLNLAFRFATHAIVLQGDGSSVLGTTAEVMQERTLSAAFGCAIARVSYGDAGVAFIPGTAS